MKKGNQILTFARAYIKSMRLYYSFITGLAGLAGISYYQFISNNLAGNKSLMESGMYSKPDLLKLLIILVILFLSWGINQIYNDYLGLKEDRINSPERPMVTGELSPFYSVLLSTLLMIGAMIITWFYLEKAALYPMIAGVILNIIYEYAKGYGIWGNIVFGFMISTCTLFGFLASGKTDLSAIDSGYIFFIVYIALINGVMTLYTYFKDYEGDKSVGKKTLIVKLGLEKSKKLALIASGIPFSVFVIIYFGFGIWDYPLNGIFIELGALATGIQLWTGYLYYKNPSGSMTYFSLAMNFRACACSESALIAIFNPALGVVLFLLSYFFIGFLFNFYVNSKS